MRTEFRENENHSCTEVEPLLENKIAGIDLSQQEESMVQHHLQHCEKCTEFMGWMGDLHHLAKTPTPQQTRAAVQNGIDRFYRVQTQKRRMMWGGAAVAAIAASVFFVLMPLTRNDASLETSPIAATCVAATPTEIASGVWLSYCAATAPAYEKDSSGNLFIDLKQGVAGISADPLRANKSRIVLNTRFGAAEVMGTIFTVQVETEDARVDVFRGTVQVTGAVVEPAPFSVNAGHGAWFLGERRIQLTTHDTNPVYDRLQTVQYARVVDDSTQKDAVANTDADDTNIKGDEANSGIHKQTTRKGTPKDRRADLERLIQEARSCLIDQNWRCAESKYQQILRQHSDQWESVSTLVSLAKIELRHLGKPKDALRHFTTYRKRYPKGPLIEEAMFGIAESYRRLGNAKMERKTLEQFVAANPQSSSVAKAQKRISELQN